MRDSQDPRKVLLECTAEGEELAARYLGPVRARSGAVVEHFGAEELHVVQRFLSATNAAPAAHRRELIHLPPNEQLGEASQGGAAGG